MEVIDNRDRLYYVGRWPVNGTLVTLAAITVNTLPAAKCKGVDFLPAVSLAFTVCGVTNFRTRAISPVLQASKSSRRGSLLWLLGKGSMEAVSIARLPAIFTYTTHILQNGCRNTHSANIHNKQHCTNNKRNPVGHTQTNCLIGRGYAMSKSRKLFDECGFCNGLDDVFFPTLYNLVRTPALRGLTLENSRRAWHSCNVATSHQSWSIYVLLRNLNH